MIVTQFRFAFVTALMLAATSVFAGSPPHLVKHGGPAVPRAKIKGECDKYAKNEGKSIKDAKKQKEQYLKDYANCMMKNGENPKD